MIATLLNFQSSNHDFNDCFTSHAILYHSLSVILSSSYKMCTLCGCLTTLIPTAFCGIRIYSPHTKCVWDLANHVFLLCTLLCVVDYLC